MSTMPPFEYKQATQAILRNLRQERDRQIVSQRFGLGLSRRHTLEKIGSSFNITRERVRQIEKAATSKLKSSNLPEVEAADQWLRDHLEQSGHVAPMALLAQKVGAEAPGERAYLVFLATLSPGVTVIDDNDHFETALGLLPDYHQDRIKEITQAVIDRLTQTTKPAQVAEILQSIKMNLAHNTLHNIAAISKRLSQMDGQWGLSSWPEVNPKSIRDKTYLILRSSMKPLHFTEIANQMSSVGNRKRDVTVQAVHNELIKDPRFVLVGRGIYALRDWGYTPGTVADIISEVLRGESPLHKDEIIKRVLQKRQVKPTTIVLNLQEKKQFSRVAKATYALKS